MKGRTMVGFKILGVNDDETVCSCCGKTNLKKVAWLAPIDPDGNDIGKPEPWGRNCAAKALRITATQVWRKAEQADRDRKREEQTRTHKVSNNGIDGVKWVVEAVGQNGGSIEQLFLAVGLKSEVERYAENLNPHRIINVRKAR